MTETELLKLLAQPGSLILALLWLNSRMNKVEARLELLADHAGAPKPQKKTSRIFSLVLGVVALTALAGCASIRQTATKTTTDEKGVVTTDVLDSRCFTMFDSSQAIAKLRASNGKTLSFGMEGENQSASTTNAVEALKQINALVNSLR